MFGQQVNCVVCVYSPGTLVAVTAVRGSTAKLPCSINSLNPEEQVLLVLWYKNASVTPVYRYSLLLIKNCIRLEGHFLSLSLSS